MTAAPRGVAVVTDSTAYLPPDLVQRFGLTVVPLQVVVGGRSLAEGVEVDSSEVARALREWRPVTTSRPSPQAFAEAYHGLGVAEVVSVHLSADLSGTVDAARAAAKQVASDGVHVAVVDSRLLGMGLGFTPRPARCPGGPAGRGGGRAPPTRPPLRHRGRDLALRRHPGVPAPRRPDRC